MQRIDIITDEENIFVFTHSLHKVKKIRQTLDTLVDKHVEEGDITVFLRSILEFMDAVDAQQPENNDTVGPMESTRGQEQSLEDEDPARLAESVQEVMGNPFAGINAERFLHREFKIAGSIGNESQKDRLSFIGLMRQIHDGLAKGYKEKELINAASYGNADYMND